jgi:hypothetical protein
VVLAGETIIAGKVPGERVGTNVVTASSSAVVSETVVQTVVAPVVQGRIYKVTWDFRINSTVAGDDTQPRLREDNISGAEIQTAAFDLPVVSRAPRFHFEAEYEADATEDKTFVGTLNRVSGSGNVTLLAATNQPALLYVDYIRDA